MDLIEDKVKEFTEPVVAISINSSVDMTKGDARSCPL